MRRFAPALLLLALAGCELGEIEHEGTIIWVEDAPREGGGFWGIVTVEGERFVPTNLPETFERDGVVVSFEAYVLADERADDEWGIPIRLTEVEINLK